MRFFKEPIPGEEKRDEYHEKIGTEDPARKILARLTTLDHERDSEDIADSHELKDILSNIEDLESKLEDESAPEDQRRSITPEIIEQLKQKVNDEQAKMIEYNLEKRLSKVGDKTNYDMKLIPELRDMYDLMTFNPYIDGEEKDQYLKLWEEKLEPRAVAAFEELMANEDVEALRVTKKWADEFPFADEETQKTVWESIDTRAVAAFEELMANEAVPDLRVTKRWADEFPFANEEKREEVMKAIQSRLQKLEKH